MGGTALTTPRVGGALAPQVRVEDGQSFLKASSLGHGVSEGFPQGRKRERVPGDGTEQAKAGRYERQGGFREQRVAGSVGEDTDRPSCPEPPFVLWALGSQVRRGKRESQGQGLLHPEEEETSRDERNKRGLSPQQIMNPDGAEANV